MIPKTYGTLKGLKVTALVYESYDEADKAAGKANAMLESGNDNGYYRGPAQDVREYICELLEAETGIERKTKETGKKDDKGVPILAFAESEGEYATKVCNQKGWEDLTAFQSKLDEWAKTANKTIDSEGKVISESPLAIDIKERERKPSGPKKLAEVYKNSAVACFKNKSVNWPRLESMLANQGVAMPTLTGDEEKDVLAVGWAIKSAKDAEAKKSLAQFTA